MAVLASAVTASIGPTTSSSTRSSLMLAGAPPPLMPATHVAAAVANKAPITGPEVFIDCLPIALATFSGSRLRERRSLLKSPQEAVPAPQIPRSIAFLESCRLVGLQRNRCQHRTFSPIQFPRLTQDALGTYPTRSAVPGPALRPGQETCLG